MKTVIGKGNKRGLTIGFVLAHLFVRLQDITKEFNEAFMESELIGKEKVP